MLYKFIGALGLVGIIAGVLIKDERKQDVFFIFGGLFLLVYSIYIGDYIFITLQTVFILVALAELIKLSLRRNWWKRILKRIN